MLKMNHREVMLISLTLCTKKSALYIYIIYFWHFNNNVNNEKKIEMIKINRKKKDGDTNT